MDYIWLTADPKFIEVYHHAFLINSETGIESDACSLCEEYMRSRVLDYAIQKKSR